MWSEGGPNPVAMKTRTRIFETRIGSRVFRYEGAECREPVSRVLPDEVALETCEKFKREDPEGDYRVHTYTKVVDMVKEVT